MPVGHVGAEQRREVRERGEERVELGGEHRVEPEVLVEEDGQRAREPVVGQSLAELGHEDERAHAQDHGPARAPALARALQRQQRLPLAPLAARLLLLLLLRLRLRRHPSRFSSWRRLGK